MGHCLSAEASVRRGQYTLLLNTFAFLLFRFRAGDNRYVLVRVCCASSELGLDSCASESRRGFQHIRFSRIGLGLHVLWSVDVSMGRRPDSASYLNVAMHTGLLSCLLLEGSADKSSSRSGRWGLLVGVCSRYMCAFSGRLGVESLSLRPSTNAFFHL